MKTYIYLILLSILTGCGQSNSDSHDTISNSEPIAESTELQKNDIMADTSVSSNLLGVWVLQEGGGYKTEYSIKETEGKLVLATKVFMPNYDPFTAESELIKVKGKYVRKEENIPNPPYLFEIKNGNLIIHDQFGIYADLNNEMRK